MTHHAAPSAALPTATTAAGMPAGAPAPGVPAGVPAAGVPAGGSTASASATRRAVLGGVGAAAAALAAPAVGLDAGHTAHAAPAGRNVSLYRCAGARLAGGSKTGTLYANGAIVIGTPAGRVAYTDPFGTRTTRTYEHGSWTTGWYSPGFAANQVVPSWRARTPAGTWISVWVQARTSTGATTAWFCLGRWSEQLGGSPTRTSVPRQGDPYATCSVDTLVARSGVRYASLRLRVTLYRPVGSRVSPSFTQVTAMSSDVATGSAVRVAASPVGVGRGRVLAVPAYSQMNHRGHYPALDGGGASWCSATSMAMLLDYWRVGPSSADTAWVAPRPHTDPQVDHAVSKVFDADYHGAGNWPFNTAYAATRGLDGFVTRLRSLTEAERFIAAGIPLAVSTAFTASQLAGAGISTNGHLMVLRGFTAAGDPILNDPASSGIASDARVRRTYRRDQFENAWARSGRLAYVVRPTSRPLPTPPAQANW